MTDSGSAYNALDFYGQWLAAGATQLPNGTYVGQRVRGAGLPTFQDVCLNHYLTHLNFGITIGLALRPTVESGGGICETGVFASDYTANTFV